MTDNLQQLIKKLNITCKQCLEDAVGMCFSKTHYDTEIQHWFIKLLTYESSDIYLLLQYYKIDIKQLKQDLLKNLDTLKRGNSQTPTLSVWSIDLTREAWLIASLKNEQYIRSAYLLAALLQHDKLRQLAYGLSSQLEEIPVHFLAEDIDAILNDSEETSPAIDDNATALKTSNAKNTSSEALKQFTINLTEQAKNHKLDPILGRDNEIRQMIDILQRRRQNNPILTGEPGVGKTAVVEGLALKIAANEVPKVLQNVAVHALDIGLLQAGAGVKGEFENRLKKLIKEIKASPHPIILFIDEAHTLIGAGGNAGQSDAANLLKPALARGELRTIAATTWSEYKKYFEQDAALTRRFQVINVEEPTVNVAIMMCRGLASTLEKHHNVKITNEAIKQAVELSHRYLNERKLPDKAISILDTACARVALSQNATPAGIENKQQIINCIKQEISMLEREQDESNDSSIQINKLNKKIKQHEQEIEQIKQKWQQEKTKLANDLNIFTHQNSIVYPCVNTTVIADVLSQWTGIPMGRMLSDEMSNIINLKKTLNEKVIGQNDAIDDVAECIQISRAGLNDPGKPLGVFLFVGPSGTGKTQTAMTLAEQLYGGQQSLTVINMSEFKEEHKASLLLGSPPGYVGYGEGGVLTEAVRRKPYSLILLDEIEKAHPGVQEIFYQVFDKGILRDGQGRDVDFKNTVIIMTSNVASETILHDNLNAKTLEADLLKAFKPAFLGRLNVVPFMALNSDSIKKIAQIKLQAIQERIKQNYKVGFKYTDELLAFVINNSQQSMLGARSIDLVLNNQILPKLANEYLFAIANNKQLPELIGVIENDEIQVINQQEENNKIKS